MYIENLGEIKAIGFDIDGTLYRSIPMYLSMFFHVIGNARTYIAYNKVRKELHKSGNYENFRQVQAEKTGALLKISAEEAEKLLDKVVYEGMKPYFLKLRTCSDSIELIRDLKAAGFKIALLSDFPPEQKGDIWGIRDICDVILGTEAVGALKPSPLPFLKMAEALDVAPEEILYVGNSLKYDVGGSQKAGMKAAWLKNPFKALAGKDYADFSFWHFKELRKLLLSKTK
ncbi:MAG: HAD family hydrolase [Treponema sp.]|nr:HAD family hydrolase [Treponema sp.]